jgi:twitching motility protein PilT
VSLHTLLATLKHSGAEKVLFTPNESPQAIDGDAKRVLPGGATKPRMIADALGELLSNDDIDDLPTNRPRIVRHEQDGEQFILEVVKQSSGIAVTVRFGASRHGAKRAETPPKARTSKRFRGVSQQPPEMPNVDIIEPARPMKPTARVDMKAAAAGDSGIELDVRPPPKRDEHVAAPPPKKAMSEPPPPTPGADILLPAEVRAQPMAPIEAPRVRTGPAKIDELLREMIAKKASDLHLSTGNHPVLRVHGEIEFLKSRPVLAASDVLGLMQEIFSEKARNDFHTLHDADFAYEVPGLARFRVNVFLDRNGTGAVLRQIPIEIVTAQKLGLPQACLDLCWLSKGLVVVTGPTGSGKSTTLAAMIDFINENRTDHIITIEDPVEFVHPNKKCLVNQREVGQHTKSFKNALRAALREDPDIVLVGEMRDLETIAIAIETAETGHLVFGTLHTTTAVSTVDRIIDQFPADRQAQIRVMLSESLKGVIAQVLLPKVGGGRVAAHEILLCTNAVSAVIRDGKTFQLPSVMQTSKGQGMVTLNDSLMQLVQKRLVEPKQAYIKAVDKNGLLSMFKNAGLPTSF